MAKDAQFGRLFELEFTGGTGVPGPQALETPMKFLCGSCRTKYQISPEKVRGKILTIRCKKCGAKILVRESLAREASGGTAVAPVAEESQERVAAVAERSVGAKTRVGGAAALASAFEVAMGGGGEEADDMPTSIAPVPANLELAGFEWYVAVDGEQQGPFAFAELVRKISNRDVAGRHYVWHDGMDNWQRVRDVPDLATYLPQQTSSAPKKRPPPPPQEAGAEVVDFASKRAERERAKTGHTGVSVDGDPTTIEPSAPATTSERAEQLDKVLNEALGIQGEGKTARAEPSSASKPEVPSIEDLLAFDPKEDIFANVPRATEADLVQRESTRFFVAAAGVNRTRSKNRIGMILGVVAAVLFIGFMGAWMTGVVKIELPGIGNPFARAETGDEDLYADNGAAEDPEAMKRRLMGESERAAVRPAKRKVVRNPGSNEPEFVEDATDSEAGGSRGGEAASEKIEIDPRAAVGSLDVPKTELPQIEGAPLPSIVGEAIDDSTLEKVVNEKKSGLQFCYEQQLKGGANLSGKLEIELTVEPTGKVSRANVKTTAFKGSKLGACITDRMKEWRFPEFRGEARTVDVPFVFQGRAF